MEDFDAVNVQYKIDHNLTQKHSRNSRDKKVDSCVHDDMHF